MVHDDPDGLRQQRSLVAAHQHHQSRPDHENAGRPQRSQLRVGDWPLHSLHRRELRVPSNEFAMLHGYVQIGTASVPTNARNWGIGDWGVYGPVGAPARYPGWSFGCIKNLLQRLAGQWAVVRVRDPELSRQRSWLAIRQEAPRTITRSTSVTSRPASPPAARATRSRPRSSRAGNRLTGPVKPRWRGIWARTEWASSSRHGTTERDPHVPTRSFCRRGPGEAGGFVFGTTRATRTA